MNRLWALLSSLRTTAWLLSTLAFLLLLNVALPQAVVLGEKGIQEAVAGSPLKAFFLITLGLGHLPTSPFFLSLLGLFFLNLCAVLVDRTGPTLRQLQVRPPSEAVLSQKAAAEEARETALPKGWDTASAVRLLRGHGYRAIPIGQEGVWGVKNRAAPLGFLFFHLSFLLLCLGGVQLFYTREVGKVRLVEGQEFEGAYGKLVRKAPLGTPPLPHFALKEVALDFVGEDATHLEATLWLPYAGGGREAQTRVNHPAHEGTTTILVEEAGVAPELWLQDGEGFTLDRVSVAANTRGEEGTTVPLQGGKYQLYLNPVWREAGFPSRQQLFSHPLQIRLLEGETLLLEGPLRPGQPLPFAGGVLQLVRYRYWGGFRLVTERGGGALILGFTLAVIGLVWRMLAYRREVGISWQGDRLRIVGRAEFYPARFRDEVESMLDSVAELHENAQEKR